MKKMFFPIFLLSGVLIFGCREKSSGPWSAKVLGTVCSVNAYGQGTGELYTKIFNRLAEIDSLFNVNVESSDVSRINLAAGKNPVAVDGEVVYVLGTALLYAEKTGGLFDPSIGPLVRLWGINTDHARVPSQDEIDSVLPLVDYRNIVVDSEKNTVFLKNKGMAIDLGGIAKGFAADEITEILRQENVAQAIVDLGGNIYVWGKKIDGSDWKVGIKNPLDEGGYPVLSLKMKDGGSVVTSGVYERNFYENGILYHHILNPKTGYPADSSFMSVSVVGDSSMVCDVLSTSAFILGPEKYFSLFNLPAVFIRAEGLIPRPSGAKPGVLNPTAIPYENTIPRCSAAGLVISGSMTVVASGNLEPCLENLMGLEIMYPDK